MSDISSQTARELTGERMEATTGDTPGRARPRYRTAAALFPRGLGLIYLVAIGSLWVQVHGLIGSEGILPVARYLDGVAAQLGPERWLRVPTLSWIGSGDLALHALCALGVGLALLVVIGRVQSLALAGLWLIYLSLVTDGQQFLAFQWDSLLLETGFLAIFLAPRPRAGTRDSDDGGGSERPPSAARRGQRMPADRRAGRGTPASAPSPIVRWLLWLVLFRLMVLSGLVKWLGGDPVWRDLTALAHHYETQPLPTWLGWAAHQLPLVAHKGAALVMYAVELAAPLLVFGPPRARRLLALLVTGLMLAVAATGNYGFFNLLTVLLALLLLDDAVWPKRIRQRLIDDDAPLPRPWPRWVTLPLAGLVLTLTAALFVGAALPGPLRTATQVLDRWRLVNSYGLFADMTVERPELIVEGSQDGRTWRRYRFRYKPGDPARRPPFVAPHMPRLDWQMWFAALGDPRHPRNGWVWRFAGRLLQGSEPVLGLLEANPFPDGPPRYVRIRRYDYRFTDPPTLLETGRWWRREPTGDYLPPLSLSDLPPSAVPRGAR